MDRNTQRCGRLIDIIDLDCQKDKLPDEDIAVPAAELPDPARTKWPDLALDNISSSKKFTELHRQEKEEYSRRLMHKMKLKNQKILQRHAEVENDRINAESQNSAVTGANVSSGSSFRRRTNVTNQNKYKEKNKAEHGREWDRGKSNLDDWYHPAKRQYRNFRESGKYEWKDIEKTDNRNSFSRKESSEFSHHDRRTKGGFNVDEQRNRGGWQNPPLKAPYKNYYKDGVLGDDWYYGKDKNYPSDDWNYGKKDRYSSDDWNAEKWNNYKGYNKNEGREYVPDNKKSHENWRSKPSDRNQCNSSHFRVSPQRTKGAGCCNDSHRKYLNYDSDDKFKKSDFKQSNSREKYPQKAHSRSSSKSESDAMENQCTLRTFILWQNDKDDECQTRQIRTENWVKSVNMFNMWAKNQLSSEEKDGYDNQFSSEKQENSRKSLTKFDRMRLSIEKDTEVDDIDLNASEEQKTENELNIEDDQNDAWNNCSQITKRSKFYAELPDSSKKTCDACRNVDDGWSDVEQSDIKWKSDAGTHLQKNKDKNLKHVNKTAVDCAVQDIIEIDLVDSTEEGEENKTAVNCAVQDITEIVLVDSSEEGEENKTAVDCAVQDITEIDLVDSSEEYEDNSFTKELSVEDDESCKLIAQVKPNKDLLPDKNDADCGTANPSGSTNIQQQESFNEDYVASEAIDTISVSLSGENHTDVSTHERVYSDDGGSSTFSEEGEVE